MPWTDITRPHYARKQGRYSSDHTDDEWVLMAPYLPPCNTTGRCRRLAKDGEKIILLVELAHHRRYQTRHNGNSKFLILWKYLQVGPLDAFKSCPFGYG